MSNIKRCKFCESENTILEAYIEENGFFAEGAVTCVDCEATGPTISNMDPSSSAYGLQSGDEIKKLAIRAWNKDHSTDNN
jgi:hypothetical protein